MKIGYHVPAVLLTLGFVLWFQDIFTIEWTSAKCSDPVDGPVHAAWGMPLPYVQWSGVSSLEYFWMPLILVLNIVLLFAVFYPLISWAIRKIEKRYVRRIIGSVGTLLIILDALLFAFKIYVGIFKIPVENITDDFAAYSELRPVGFGYSSLRYDCTKSEFWFPKN